MPTFILSLSNEERKKKKKDNRKRDKEGEKGVTGNSVDAAFSFQELFTFLRDGRKIYIHFTALFLAGIFFDRNWRQI